MTDDFNDPCVRCTECQRLIFMPEIKEFGACPDCGCKRVRNVLTLNEKEQKLLIDKGFDDFLQLFEGVSNA